jgi:flavin reductase (DIM6/NTAB) family NADH-FMN oxidoreductase RutF
MEYDFSRIAPDDGYRILTSLVVPRPIAWVTTVSETGVVNVAPFSFFNAMGADPAIVALGIGHRPNGQPKDSLRNIAETGEFVVNLVTYAAREAMNQTAAAFPPEVSELDALKLEAVASVAVRPPRLALAPAGLECRRAAIVEVGDNRVIIGEVLRAFVDDRFIEPGRGRIATEAMDLIGRMNGADGYVRTRERFTMARVTVPSAMPGGDVGRERRLLTR